MGGTRNKNKEYNPTENPKVIEEVITTTNEFNIESAIYSLESYMEFLQNQLFKIVPDQECLDFWNVTNTKSKRIKNVIENGKVQIEKLLFIKEKSLIPESLMERYLTIKTFFEKYEN